MENKIRITGNSQAELLRDVTEYFKNKIISVYSENIIETTSNTITVKNPNDTIGAKFSYSYNTQTVAIDVYIGTIKLYLMRITTPVNMSSPYSIDIISNEGENYFHFKRATMRDDTLPVGSPSYGAVGYAESIDSEDKIYMLVYDDLGLRTNISTYKGYPNTFWDLSNFAIPQGQIALFNPGNGHHFFKDIYRHSANVAGLTIPDFSYQEIAGLGRFFIFPGPIWIKEA